MSLRARTTGVIGGAQAGYNWQIGSWVTGLEADIQGSDIEGSARGTPTIAGTAIPLLGGVISSEQKLSWPLGMRPRDYAVSKLAQHSASSTRKISVMNTRTSGLSSPALTVYSFRKTRTFGAKILVRFSTAYADLALWIAPWIGDGANRTAE